MVDTRSDSAPDGPVTRLTGVCTTDRHGTYVSHGSDVHPYLPVLLSESVLCPIPTFTPVSLFRTIVLLLFFLSFTPVSPVTLQGTRGRPLDPY